MDTVSELLILALLPGVGPRTIRDLAGRGPLRAALDQPDRHPDLLPAEARARLGSGAGRRRAADELATAQKLGVSLLGWDDADYPALLRRAYDPPPVLYVRGQVAVPPETIAVAVVGARNASWPGRVLAHAFGRDLAAGGVTVVSGLARGIDRAAHEGALAAGGHTVAILGSALDRLYPPENAKLADAITERGAVVSEFPFGTGPQPGNFPRRNRVIAGWSQALVVVEAAEKSGALITARYALEEGREVMAVPGHPSQRGAMGTNQLIRDGAALVRDATDVAAELGLEPQPAGTPTANGTILDLLRADVPASIEELQARSGRAVPELLSELGLLEVEARIRRLPGPLYLRI